MGVRVLTEEDLLPLQQRIDQLEARLLERLEAPAEWATPEQAAELLGVTPSTVRRWAASGRLRASREGSRWRIARGALPATKPGSPEAAARVALASLVR